MYKLTESLPFMLLTITSHLTGAFAAELAEERLTISMYRVMAALMEREDQRLGELSEMIFLEVTALSRLIGAMSHRGLVTRHRQEQDERSLRINITAQGRALLQTLIPRARYFEGIATRGVEEAKLGLLSEILSDMLSNVEDLKSQMVAGRRSLVEVAARPGRPATGVAGGEEPAAAQASLQNVGTMMPAMDARPLKKAKTSRALGTPDVPPVA